MNAQEIKNIAAGLDVSLTASRTDGVYDFLTFTGPDRDDLIAALPAGISWERRGTTTLVVDVLRAFDRNTSW